MLRCHRESTNWREFCITEMNRAYIAKVPLKSFSFVFKYMFKTYTFTRSNIYPLSINASVNVLILWWLHFHIQRLTNNYKFSRKYSSNILHIFVILHWIDWIFSAQKKIFHHRKLTEEEICENFRKPWWLYSVGGEQRGMQTELSGSIGKAHLKLFTFFQQGRKIHHRSTWLV